MSAETLRRWVRQSAVDAGEASGVTSESAREIRELKRPYWAQVTRPPSKRALWDTTITELLAGFYRPGAAGRRAPESLYGSLQMWKHLRRLGCRWPAAPSSG
jgi:putative transposase